MLNTTKMCQDRGKLGFNKGTYYIPQVVRELVVTNSLNYKVENHLGPAFEEIAEVDTGDLCISTQSCTRLSAIAANSIDYIFTDPPYAEKVQYGELNFVWEAWLDFDTTWHDEEIIVNGVRGKICRRLGSSHEEGHGRVFSSLEAWTLAESVLSRYV